MASAMESVTLQVPDALFLEADGSLPQLERRSQFWLALKLFELGKVSSGQAAEMCGLNRVDFLLKAGRQGVAVADLNNEELAAEVKNAFPG